MYKDKYRAFTLIELSIVLALIGLIVAGIVSARGIIRNAGMYRMMQDVRKYEMAVITFRDRYSAIPGDMKDASNFWSTAINGDGDGLWNHWSYDGAYAWQHMSFAGILDFAFAAGSASAQDASNIPTVSYMEGGGFHFSNDRFLLFGTSNPGDRYSGSILTQTEMKRIDEKYDDGFPGSGSLQSGYSRSYGSWGCTCPSSCDLPFGTAAPSSTYPISDLKNCLLYKQMFKY